MDNDKEFEHPYVGQDGALRWIFSIGFDYDGMDGSIESMKQLVDELVGIAEAGIELKDNFDALKKGYGKQK